MQTSDRSLKRWQNAFFLVFSRLSLALGAATTTASPHPPANMPPPPEGTLEQPPENEQYLYEKEPPYTLNLPEEAELYDEYSMTPDVDTHTNPAMAVRHLGLMLAGISVFGVFVYALMPTKPTGTRILNYEAVDKDYGNYLDLAGGRTPKGFRDLKQ